MTDSHAYARKPIDELYEWFATETAPTSPVWAELCTWIAETPAVLQRLDELPGQARQPNRFLAALRFLDGPTEPGPAFLAWVETAWPRLREVIVTRTTQTNEAGRCAILAPVLAALPQPVALVELGASAGLCLLADRFRYRFVGDGEQLVAPAAAATDAPELACQISGPLPGDPSRLTIASRLGIDRNPLDVTDPDVQRWLRALIWPGEGDRERLLAAALDVAAAHPPAIRVADLTLDPDAVIGEALSAVRRAAPDATPVVMHSAVLAYLTRTDRARVIEAIRASGAHWLSFEGPTIIDEFRSSDHLLGPDPGEPHFIAALDGVPLARCQPHGRWAWWAPAA